MEKEGDILEVSEEEIVIEELDARPGQRLCTPPSW